MKCMNVVGTGPREEDLLLPSVIGSVSRERMKSLSSAQALIFKTSNQHAPWSKLLVSLLPSPKLKFLELAIFLSVSPDPVVTGCPW